MSQTAPTVLVPVLTAWDRRVLDTLPTVPLGQRPWTGISAWQAAEALGTDDVADVRRILKGLARFGHAIGARSRSRGITVYARLLIEETT